MIKPALNLLFLARGNKKPFPFALDLFLVSAILNPQLMLERLYFSSDLKLKR